MAMKNPRMTYIGSADILEGPNISCCIITGPKQHGNVRTRNSDP